jgi:MinD-like ATPase involved in chromosome partitioning or flagellar assembly
MCAFLKQHIISGELSYLPAFKTPIVSVGLSFELYRWFIETIKKQGDYDYIVVDSDSAFNQEKVDLISCADKVIFVTDQSDKGINSTNQILKHLSEVNDGKYMFVCNKFHSVPGGITKYEMSSENYKISEYIEACSDGKIGFGTLSSLSGIRRLSFLLQ